MMHKTNECTNVLWKCNKQNGRHFAKSIAIENPGLKLRKLHLPYEVKNVREKQATIFAGF